MKQGYLAILDSDREYVECLGQFFNESSFMALRVLVFYSQDKFDTFLSEEKADVILVQESLWKEEYARQNGILFCENRLQKTEKIPWIYKYQAARNIGQEIMDFYAKSADSGILYSGRKKTDVFSVFPVGDDRIGTVFAWELAKVLGKRRKTLYVNLKPFPGMGTRLEKNWKEDITDCIYFLEKGEGNPAIKIQAVIQQEERFSYLPPAHSEEDIGEISVEAWREFLHTICSGLDYETVILDLWDGAADFRFWIEESNYMFTPLTDVFAQVRIAERRNWLESRGEEAILKKWICFPGEGFKRLSEFTLEEDTQVIGFLKGLLKENEVLDGEI